MVNLRKIREVKLSRLFFLWTSLVAQTVKRLPTIQESRVQFLGREDPLEREMATHSSTLPGKSQDLGRLQFMGPQRVDTTERLRSASFHFIFSITTRWQQRIRARAQSPCTL